MKVYSGLVKQIRDAVSEEARHNLIKEGCVRILAYPCCEPADQWLGGMSNFSTHPSPDIVDYEYAFPIIPGGSRVTEVTKNGTTYNADCYGLSALKIAHCSYSQDAKNCLLSGVIEGREHLVETNGYCPEFGALCAEVKYDVISVENGELCTEQHDFCGIYVSVSSGGPPIDDLQCAFAAIKAIEEFFMGPEWDCDIFEVITPKFPSE